MKVGCRYFNSCSAPLCPKDEKSLEHGSWFPGEETCRLSPMPEFVKRQRKITRKISFEAGCFTYRMLQQKCRVSSGMKGVYPDKGMPHELEADWLKKHPPLEVSEKQIAAAKKMARERLAI